MHSLIIRAIWSGLHDSSSVSPLHSSPPSRIFVIQSSPLCWFWYNREQILDAGSYHRPKHYPPWAGWQIVLSLCLGLFVVMPDSVGVGAAQHWPRACLTLRRVHQTLMLIRPISNKNPVSGSGSLIMLNKTFFIIKKKKKRLTLTLSRLHFCSQSMQNTGYFHWVKVVVYV